VEEDPDGGRLPARSRSGSGFEGDGSGAAGRKGNGVIPESELRFEYAHAGGPGGQHVNKVATKVILLFDVEASPSLDESQKARIRNRLATRINRDGILKVSCRRHRSRSMNREAAVARFHELLEEALAVPKKRRKTRVTRAQKEKRLEDKKKRSRLKQDRRARE
jgi:ribosome-associated protein